MRSQTDRAARYFSLEIHRGFLTDCLFPQSLKQSKPCEEMGLHDSLRTRKPNRSSRSRSRHFMSGPTQMGRFILPEGSGIDASETSRKKHEPGQPFSQRSTKQLSGLVLNKAVEIKGYGMARYNRVLGEIFVDGKNVNLEMVKAGLAEVHRGTHAPGFDPSPYLEAEKEAREAKRGMWVQGEKYLSPRDWRAIQREK
jgi:hypothetical protein